MSEKKTVPAFLMVLTAAAVLAAVFFPRTERKTPGERRSRTYFDLFDTVSYISSYADESESEFRENAAAAYEELLKYHRLLDIYNAYEGMNNLFTVNSSPGTEVTVDDALIDFLLYAEEIFTMTDGRTDITLGPVLSLWHDARYSSEHFLPQQEALEEASAYSGFRYLEINREKRTVKLLSDKASIDAGSIGKGYAAEKAAEVLKRRGAGGYVISLGGNVRIIGEKGDGTGWRTGIRNPFDGDGFIAVLSLRDTSCVTSGSYERYFEYEGVRYSHIIDPETLLPPRYFVSVTVVTEDSALADAFSTALFCLPYERGRQMAEKYGMLVLWVFPDGKVEYTDALEDMIISIGG